MNNDKIDGDTIIMNKKNKNNNETQKEEHVLDYWGKSEFNVEFFYRLNEGYEKYLQTLDDADYEVNAPQMQKLIELLELFENMSNEPGNKYNIEIAPVDIEPRVCHVHVVVTATYLKIAGRNDFGKNAIQVFKDAIGSTAASEVRLTTLTTGQIELRFCVPSVYKRKLK